MTDFVDAAGKPVTVIQHRGRQRAEREGRYIYAGRPSKWGNPYHIGPTRPRNMVIALFTVYWHAEEQVQLRADALQEIPPGSVLGCFCHPLPCHCDIIAEFLNHART